MASFARNRTTQLMQQQKTYPVAAGVHTVVVSVSGNKNAASAGTFVLVDALIVASEPPPPPPPPPAVGPGTYEDTNSFFFFCCSYTRFLHSFPTRRSSDLSSQTGAQVSLTFDGALLTFVHL